MICLYIAELHGPASLLLAHKVLHQIGLIVNDVVDRMTGKLIVLETMNENKCTQLEI